MPDTSPTAKQFRDALNRNDLQKLFREELGWDNPQGGAVSVEVKGETYSFKPVARKANFTVLQMTGPDGALPSKALMRVLEQKLDTSVAERLVIYQNAAADKAIWVRFKKDGQGTRRLHTAEFTKGRRNEVLTQYLGRLYISLDDDIQGMTTIDVAQRASGLEVEKVTKKFYKEFDTIRKAFIKQIEGIEDPADRDHYAGLTLNRLMFVYFIQKKGYLDNDIDYLGKRLRMVQDAKGTGKFHSFYRSFLIRLFHEGLGTGSDDADLVKLIGKVPYLNGGLFEEHEIEAANKQIKIPDEAFKKVFAFFEGWRWTIDERQQAEAATDDKRPEINPDVLGYIFEGSVRLTFCSADESRAI